MDHQAGTYIYDPEGRLRLYARYGIGPQAMAQDIAALLK
jgi:protein SCO1/2